MDPWGKSRNTETWEELLAQAKLDTFGIFSKPISTHGYTGHEHLDEVGLVHMNGRIYDDTLSRFVQADPVIQEPYRSASLNRYSYVWNNPLNATDPSGFIASCGGGDASEGAECRQERVAEESQRKVGSQGSNRSNRSRQSGLGWKVTDRKAFNEYLKKTGQTQNEFEEKMEKNGVSKSSLLPRRQQKILFGAERKI